MTVRMLDDGYYDERDVDDEIVLTKAEILGGPYDGVRITLNLVPLGPCRFDVETSGYKAPRKPLMASTVEAARKGKHDDEAS